MNGLRHLVCKIFKFHDEREPTFQIAKVSLPRQNKMSRQYDVLLFVKVAVGLPNSLPLDNTLNPMNNFPLEMDSDKILACS